MNRTLASFTRSEKSIIVFLTMLVASGMGIKWWMGSGVEPSAFTLPESKPVERSLKARGVGTEGRVNINKADAAALETLPDVGPAMAAAIIRHRETKGPLRSTAELDAVPGVGPAMLSKVAPVVDFETSAPVQAPAPVVMPAIAAPVASLAPAIQQAPVGQDGPVNINTATEAELDTLVGVGPALARRIIEDRQRHGFFGTADSLTRVKGIGPKVLQQNRGRIRVQ